MPELADFGLTDEDLERKKVQTGQQDLSLFGLEPTDFGRPNLQTTENPGIVVSPDGRRFRRRAVEPGEIPSLPGQPETPGGVAGYEEVLPETETSVLSRQQATKDITAPLAMGASQLQDMGAAFNRSLVGIADLPFILLDPATYGAPIQRSMRPSELPVIREGIQGSGDVEGLVPKGITKGVEFFGAGLPLKGAGMLAKPQAISGQFSTTQGVLKQFALSPVDDEIRAAMGGGLASSAVDHNEVLSDSEVAKFLAPIIGGLAAVAPKAIIQQTKKSIQKSKNRASEVLVLSADDPDQAVRELAQKRLTDIGGAAQSGDVGVMTLARSLAKENPIFEGQLDDQFMLAQHSIKQEIDNLFLPDGRPVSETAVQDFLAKNVDDMIKLKDNRVQAALEKVKDIALIYRGNLDDIQLSRRAKVELASALDDVKNQSQVLWNHVDKGIELNTTPLKQAAVEMVNNSNKETILPVETLSRIIGTKIVKGKNGYVITKKPVPDGYNPKEPLGVLLELRSNLSAELRAETKDAISTKVAPKIAQLNDAALRTIEANPAQSEAYKAAAKFTREMHETFDKGLIGKILASNTKGGEAIVSEKTLSFLLSGAEQQAAGVRELGGAASLSRQSSFLKTSQEYLASKFSQQVKTPEDAANFVLENKQAIDKFPQLKKTIMAAMDDINKQAGIVGRAEAGKAAIEKSVFAKMAGMNGRQYISRILNEKNPRKLTRQLKLLIQNDPQALKGFQRDLVDDILSRSEKGIKLLPTNDRALTEKTLDSAINRLKPILDEFYPKDALKNVDILRKELSKLHRLQGAPAGAVDLPRNMLTDLLARSFGARMAASLVGGNAGPTLIAASAGSRAGRHIIFSIPERATKAVLEEAMLDPKLMAKLLKQGMESQVERKALEDSIRIILRQQIGAQAAEEYDANLEVINGQDARQ